MFDWTTKKEKWFYFRHFFILYHFIQKWHMFAFKQKGIYSNQTSEMLRVIWQTNTLRYELRKKILSNQSRCPTDIKFSPGESEERVPYKAWRKIIHDQRNTRMCFVFPVKDFNISCMIQDAIMTRQRCFRTPRTTSWISLERPGCSEHEALGSCAWREKHNIALHPGVAALLPFAPSRSALFECTIMYLHPMPGRAGLSEGLNDCAKSGT